VIHFLNYYYYYYFLQFIASYGNAKVMGSVLRECRECNASCFG